MSCYFLLKNLKLNLYNICTEKTWSCFKTKGIYIGIRISYWPKLVNTNICISNVGKNPILCIPNTISITLYYRGSILVVSVTMGNTDRCRRVNLNLRVYMDKPEQALSPFVL